MKKSLKQEIRKTTSTPEYVINPEYKDLLLLLTCMIVIPLTWMVLLGWGPSHAVSGHDGIMFMPFFRDLMNKGGDWRNLLYSFEVSGGQLSHDAIGDYPLFKFTGLLGLSAVGSFNILGMFIQLCFGFLSSKAALDLASLWKENQDEKIRVTWIHRLAFTWIFSFAPVLAWRINYGHWIIALGILVFLSVFTLSISVRAKSLSYTLAGVSFLALINTFPSGGQQTVFYSVAFGGPIVLGVLWPQEGWSWKYIRSIVPALMIVLGALGVSMPNFAGLLAHALGSEASRGIGGESVTYSYTTGKMADWIASIPWTKEWIPASRAEGFWHEVNYPFGPILLLMFLVPWRKNRALKIGFLTSFVFALVFSMNWKPFSTWMLAAIPPLKSFRVPERAMLPFGFALPILGIAGLMIHLKKLNDWKVELAAGGFAAILFFLSPVFREVLIWPALGWGIYFLYKKKHNHRFAIPVGALLVILGAGSVGGWKERLIRFESIQDIFGMTDAAKNAVYQLDPRLKNPLNRALVNFQVGPYYANTSYAIGVSSPSAYWFPVPRLLKFLSALEGFYYEPTTMVITISESMPNFPIYRQVFNILDSLDADQGRIAKRDLGSTLGPAWFSDSLSPVNSYAELAQVLKNHNGDIASVLVRQAMYISDDRAIQNLDSKLQADAGCSRSKVLSTDAVHGDHSVHLTVENAAQCPLTLSMNYYNRFKARTVLNGNIEKEIPVFPVFGTLTGVLVPAGAREIWIEPVPYIPLWAHMAWTFGWLLIIGAALLIWKSRRPMSRLVSSSVPKMANA